MNAISTVDSWLATHANAIAERGVEVHQESRTESLAGIWLYCSKHLVDISVWNHAYCLDILVLDADDGTQVFSRAGSCQTAEGVTQRLEELWSWVIAEYPT